MITEKLQQNDRGVLVPVGTRSSEVFCRVGSVSRIEFFEGGRNGLNPSMVFQVFAGDYHGEEICEYLGRRYSIYRTYMTDSDYMELYAERKGGTNDVIEKNHGC